MDCVIVWFGQRKIEYQYWYPKLDIPRQDQAVEENKLNKSLSLLKESLTGERSFGEKLNG